MAAVVLGVSTASTTDSVNTYAAGSSTPAANDLLVVFVGSTDSVIDGTRRMTVPGHTRSSARKRRPPMGLLCGSSCAPPLPRTLQRSSLGTAPGIRAPVAIITAFRVSGITRAGTLAVAGHAGISNGAVNTVPTLAFTGLTATYNPTGSETAGRVVR